MTNEMKQVMQKLDKIESDLNYLKEHMIDPDKILDEDDLNSIEDAEKDFKERRTISHKKLKKELGLNV